MATGSFSYMHTRSEKDSLSYNKELTKTLLKKRSSNKVISNAGGREKRKSKDRKETKEVFQLVSTAQLRDEEPPQKN